MNLLVTVIVIVRAKHLILSTNFSPQNYCNIFGYTRENIMASIVYRLLNTATGFSATGHVVYRKQILTTNNQMRRSLMLTNTAINK